MPDRGYEYYDENLGGLPMKKSIRILVVLTFLAMVVVNALANILPINGIGTGAVSDSYPNLFAPAALTFAIWGLIYLLLAGYTLYQLGLLGRIEWGKDELLNKVGLVFSFSSVANTIWIFAWHYQVIALSMFLMLCILVSLIIIVNMIQKEHLSTKQKILIRLPFSVYFGWITVATIANVTTLLVSLNWNGFGIDEALWTTIIISVGALIGILVILKNKDWAYGLVILWAYLGILLKHRSVDGFDGMYLGIITTVVVAMVLVAVAVVYAFFKKDDARAW